MDYTAFRVSFGERRSHNYHIDATHVVRNNTISRWILQHSGLVLVYLGDYCSHHVYQLLHVCLSLDHVSLRACQDPRTMDDDGVRDGYWRRVLGCWNQLYIQHSSLRIRCCRNERVGISAMTDLHIWSYDVASEGLFTSSKINYVDYIEKGP